MRITEQQHLFNQIKSLKYGINRMASIVQNEGAEVSAEELGKWTKDVNSLIREVHDLKIEVNDFYMKKINKDNDSL